MSLNIADLFEYAVDAVPDRTAIVVDGTALLRRARRAGQPPREPLPDQGLGHGDHIGIYGQNSDEWVVAMLAAFKIRAVPINMNFRYVDGRTHVPVRQRRSRRARLRPRVRAAGRGGPRGRPRGSGTSWRSRTAAATRPGSRGAVRGGVAAGVAGPRLRRALARRPLRPLHRRHHRHAEGRHVAPGGRLYALGGGIDATRRADRRRVRPAGRRRRGERRATVAPRPPLMHGAAQWGALRFLFEGNTVVFLPKFSAEAVWRP